MTQSKLIAIIVVALIVGFVAGFAARPALGPAAPAIAGSSALPAATAPAAPRSVVYFSAHIDDARSVVARCRDGALGGDECANADQAVVTADSRDRAARFLGKRTPTPH